MAEDAHNIIFLKNYNWGMRHELRSVWLMNVTSENVKLDRVTESENIIESLVINFI